MSDQPQTPLPVGETLGRFTIQKVIAMGGFGITYLCSHNLLGKKVAVKECYPFEIAKRVGKSVVPISAHEAEFFAICVRDAQRESQTMAQFSHANIVSISDSFEENGTWLTVMHYIEGADLRTHIANRTEPKTEQGILALMKPLLDGLTHVHALKIIHRDIKPANIIIEPSGNPILVDFGAARNMAKVRKTLVMTNGYAPIEQYDDYGQQGPWTDIYACAAVIYHIINGKPPSHSELRNARDDYVPLSSRGLSAYSSSFLNAVDWGLAVRPENRPKSVVEWLDALAIHFENKTTADKSFLKHPIEPTPGFKPPPVEYGSPSNAWCLVLKKATGEKVSIAFGIQDFGETEGCLIIGRASRFCDYTITDDSLSRQHATLLWSDNELFLEDRNSTNGTYVNGNKLEPFKPVKVEKGTSVNIGLFSGRLE